MSGVRIMKALTVWQPWASLIMIGAKPWEFRDNSYFDYIGPPKPGERIVIQAGARPIRPVEVFDLLQQILRDPASTALVPGLARPLLERVLAAPKCRGLVLGAGLGTVVIGEPQRACDALGMEVADSERGEFNWAWPMLDPRPFDAPIPMRGRQGFWRWPGAIQ